MTTRLRTQLTYTLIAIILTLILFFTLQFTTTWRPYLNWLVATNLIAFLLYGLDKLLAKAQSGRQNTRRAPNLTLHLITLLGGFIGAFIGRALFRHKSNFRQNPQFLIIIILSAILHLALLYWYHFLRVPNN